MLQLIEANWPLVAGAVAVLLLLAVLLLRSRTKTPERREFNDVLSEGAAPAQRNTALIDAPPAAAIVPPPAPAAPPPAPVDMAPAEVAPVDVARRRPRPGRMSCRPRLWKTTSPASRAWAPSCAQRLPVWE